MGTLTCRVSLARTPGDGTEIGKLHNLAHTESGTSTIISSSLIVCYTSQLLSAEQVSSFWLPYTFIVLARVVLVSMESVPA